MTVSVEAIVVGAGAVGLAVARALAQRGHEVVVVERHARVGEETSSRNSGVIHSGIYYPGGTLKAQLCVQGRELLYRYCAERDIAHRRLGKIIVAQPDQVEALRALYTRGTANGVPDLQWLSAAEVSQLEPPVRCAVGLLCPSTGIIDVHELLMTLWGDLERAGGTICFHSELLGASASSAGFRCAVRGSAGIDQFDCRWLVNSAGLGAVELLTKIAGYPPALHKRMHYAKGNYFAYRGGKPFSRLIYPMPNEAGLGVHVTLDLAGATRFGPDVEWVSGCDYAVDETRADSFYAAIKSYWPDIPAGSLQPAYAGIRPKLAGPGAKAADFLIEDESHHGVPGLVNLLGIESPGITSSLALAQEVLGRLTQAAGSRSAEMR